MSFQIEGANQECVVNGPFAEVLRAHAGLKLRSR
jgi:hypothetical protein